MFKLCLSGLIQELIRVNSSVEKTQEKETGIPKIIYEIGFRSILCPGYNQALL